MNDKATLSATTPRSKDAGGAAEVGRPSPRSVKRVLLLASRLQYSWLVPLLFLGLAIAATWPWILKPDTTVMALTGGDVSSSIAKFNAIVLSDVVPFASDRITAVGFPDGAETTPGVDSAAVLNTLYLWAGTQLIGSVETHGLMAVLGFFLTGMVTYLFVRRVTGSSGAGLVAGIAYGFFPHLYLMAYAATTYTHMWLLLLPMWAFWNLAESPGRRSALIAGASLIPAMFWTPYYALHVFVVSVACWLVVFALAKRLSVPRRLLGLALVPWAAAIFVYVGIGVATSFSDAPDRPLTDFYQQAAHPLMFVWPGFASIWGDGVEQALVDRVPRASKANLYVGLSVIALALTATWTLLRPWVTNRLRGRPSPMALAALLAFATVFASLLCSLPPRVLDGQVPMPASIIFEVAPGLRAGQRFVMPLMGGMAVLAGLGTATILSRLPRVAVFPAVLVLAATVGVDLHTSPPGMTSELAPRPSSMETLARSPDGAALHIFAEGIIPITPQRACMMQLVHKKKLLNSCAFSPPTPRLSRLALRPICEALRTMRRSGLRYVITDNPPPPNVAACFRPRSRVGDWRMLVRDRYLDVFELVPATA